MHRRVFAGATATMAEVFNSAGKSLPISALALAVALGGLANILELDRLVSNAVDASDITTALGLLFDAATQRPSTWRIVHWDAHPANHVQRDLSESRLH